MRSDGHRAINFKGIEMTDSSHLTEHAAAENVADKSFRILSLDGGGAKGFYTIGALVEIEALLGGGAFTNVST